MTTVFERKKIAELVLTTQDEVLLEKVKVLIQAKLNSPKGNFIRKYNKEIADAVARVRSGKFVTEQDADAILAEWERK
ncbi:MAG: hypothetical protein K1X81_04345 [Bacteroidia bacterium]|nr:hypothetical protein [Bacteroidia bacterium]